MRAAVARAAAANPRDDGFLVATGKRIQHWHPDLVSIALGLLAAACAARSALVIRQEWRDPNYAMPSTVVAVAALCGVLTMVGAYVAARDTNGLRLWLTVLTALLLWWGFLGTFSIGLGLLIAAIACLVICLRLVYHQPLGGRHFLIGGGLFLPVGLIRLSALSISGPVVRCIPGGVQSSGPIWVLFESASGRSGMTSSGSVTSRQAAGHLTFGRTTYGYTCTNGRLPSFQPG